MLPSTDLKASAPRTIAFSVLNSPAHPYRYRRFACPLTGTDARLAEKRGSVTPSFQGTSTPYLLPVRLAHQILVLPIFYRKNLWVPKENDIGSYPGASLDWVRAKGIWLEPKTMTVKDKKDLHLRMVILGLAMVVVVIAIASIEPALACCR